MATGGPASCSAPKTPYIWENNNERKALGLDIPNSPSAQELMNEFAHRTGLLNPGDPQRRYLWTDAFAVCNFLELYRQTHDEKYRDLALLLVDRVHHVLGRHRGDDGRKGWISGLDEREGEKHPTIGGLRIGKELGERGPGDPHEARLEWDRDGQYYHYLTKWMHALNQVSSKMGDLTYRRWAVELAKAAYKGFTYSLPSGLRRMYWKMSIDLSYPLVPSMGHHDPLDGLLTCRELQAGMTRGPEESPDLGEEIKGLAAMCLGSDWTTDDPLGIGGLLSDAFRAAQITALGGFQQTGFLTDLLRACRTGLQDFEMSGLLEAPVNYRLAFRELGLSIGLHALERLRNWIEGKPGIFDSRAVGKQVEDLLRYLPLAGRIEHFWLQPANRKSQTFTEHLDINTVMLATSLVPEGFLVLSEQ